MTITAPEPDSQASERVTDSAAAVDALAVVDGHGGSPPGRGELGLVAVAERDDTRAGPGGRVALPPGRLAPSGAGEPARRLRLAPAVQLELVSEREGSRPAVVWACLPEPARQAVLVLLARLIGAGAIEEEAS